jgi:TatD DNase family protein
MNFKRYLDAHCHIDFPNPQVALDQELLRARDMDIYGGILGGTSLEHWKQHQAFCQSHQDFYWTMGLHPVYVKEENELQSLDAQMHDFLDSQCPPIGIGELGIDRKFRPRASEELQIKAFRQQLAFARAYDLPVVLHIVGAHGIVLELLKRDGLPKAKGMIHAFTAPWEMGKAYCQLGLLLSFGGVVTWENANKVKQSALQCPLSMLLIETDAPDQAPQSLQLPHQLSSLIPVAQSIGLLRGVDHELLLAQSTENLKQLFKIS